MAKTLFTEQDLLANPTHAQIVDAQAGLGMFADSTHDVSEYVQHQDNSDLQALVQQFRNDNQAKYLAQEQMVSNRNSALNAERKRAEMEEAARLKALAVNRKASLLYNPDGTLKQDSDLELHAKNFVNGGIDLWNKANDFIPDFLIKDKTLDIDSHLKGTVAGMAHEDLANKDLFGARDMSKKQVLDTVNSLQDDPNGQGTLYYLRKNIGTTEDPEYIYKPGFAQLNAADRYRQQANAAGWDIVHEVQSSGSAETERLIHAKFIGDRFLGADGVKGKDGKYHSRDEASGIDFGSGYTEIYNKDILGWDKQPTKGDVNKYKVGALKDAMASGMSSEQLKAYRAALNAITPAQLHQMQIDQNKEKSYAERDARDAYKATNYKDDAWTGAKAGLNKFGRELADDALDILTPAGMTQESSLGQWLQSDGKGNSERLDSWKSQEAADKYVHYDRKKSDEFANSIAYHAQKGDYVGALGDVFSQGGLNMTSESLGYMAPMLLSSILATPFTGGASDVAGAIGIGSKIKNAFTTASELKSSINAAKVAGNASKVAIETEKLTAAEAIVNSGAREIGTKMTSAANIAESLGFYTQAAAMTNERIDAHMKNNGGQPTSMFENAAIFAETVVENYVDKAVDLAVLGAGGHKELQQVYSLLDNVAKKNIATKVAAKAVALTASSGVEGATEYIQNIGQSFSEQYDTKKNGGTVSGILGSKENKQDNLVNFLMGAASGVHMQAIPSGIGLAKDGITNAWDKVSGNAAKKEMIQKRAVLADQVVSGTANPYSGSVSFSGKDEASTRSDINNIATSSGQLPMQIAIRAIQNVNGEATDISASDMVRNINNSLKTSYGIDEHGQGKTEADTAIYDHAIYTSAMETLKHVINFTADSERFLKDKGFSGTTVNTSETLKSVMDSYKDILPPASMNMLTINIAHDVIEHLKKTTDKAGLQTNDSDSVSKQLDPNANYTDVNIASLEEALKSMKNLMGSADNGGKSGYDGKDGGFSSEQVKGTLSQIAKAIHDKIVEAKKTGHANIDGTFYDHLKSLDKVGSEILFDGKRNADGTPYGKGVYKHAEDVVRNIIDVQNSVKGKTKVDTGNMSLFSTFALGRLKAKSLSSDIKPGEFYTRDQIWNTDHNGEHSKYGTNYIPQMDATGKTTERKILEAKHIITAAKQIKAALVEANNISKADKDFINEKANAIITKQLEDVADLTKYLKLIDGGKGITSKLLFVDLRKQKQNDPEVKAKIAEAMALKDDKGRSVFGQNDPIMTYVTRHGSTVAEDADMAEYNEEDDISDTTLNTATEAKSEQAEDKAKTRDNTDEQSKEGKPNEQERPEERSDEQRSSGESSEEAPKSTKDSQDDKQRAEKHQEPDGPAQTGSVNGTETPSSFNSKLFDAENDALSALQDESVDIVTSIANDNGLDYSYNLELSLSDNLKELRKVITAKVNTYKASAKISIIESLGKIEKLSTLLTAAVKGEGLIGISGNKDIQKAKALNDVKKSASLSGNQDAKDTSHKTKRIAAIRKLIDKAIVDGDIKAQWKHMTSLAKLLGVPLPSNIQKQEPRGFAAKKSHEENGTHSSFKEDTPPTKAEVTELERLLDVDNSMADESSYEEENHIYDIDQDGINAIVDEVALELASEKEVAEASDPKINIFAAIDGITAKSKYDENHAKITELKAAVKAKAADRLSEIVKELKVQAIKELDGAVLTKDQISSLNKKAKKQLENEMKDC